MFKSKEHESQRLQKNMIKVLEFKTFFGFKYHFFKANFSNEIEKN